MAILPYRIGAKKALSISIGYSEFVEYHKKSHPKRDWEFYRLKNSYKDSLTLRRLLIDVYGFEEKDIRIMSDWRDKKMAFELPTMEAMRSAMEDLVRDAKEGDHFVFHYSGHGSQIVNENGTEIDGFDEVIWPTDARYNIVEGCDDKIDNYIIDDDLKKILVDSLPPGTHLTVLLDCCHSETAMDLPFNHADDTYEEKWVAASPEDESKSFIYPVPPTDENDPARTSSTDSKIKSVVQRAISIETVMEKSRSSSTGSTIVRRDSKGEVTRIMGLPFSAKGHTTCQDGQKQTHIEEHVSAEIEIDVVPDKHVVSWAACLDAQITVDSRKGGSLTQSMNTLLRKDHKRTNRQLLTALSEEFYTVARNARRAWRKSSKEELKKYAEELTLPKPSIGCLVHTNHVLDKDFTF